MVDPEKKKVYEEFYDVVKAKKQVVVSLEIIGCIKSDAQRTFGLHLAELSTEERVVRIVNVLAIFVTKNSEIGYHFGMTFIVGLLLSVFSNEKEVFVMFCHIIENVYPPDFFLSENRELGLHRELLAISKMAEILRPKLINTLKVVFTPAGSKKKETDLTPFTLFIKRTTEGWIRSLFVPNLILEDTYRVWDCILIYGFDFLVKFSLCLLSHNETFIKNTIKQETKQLSLGINTDSLITSGNLTRIKLFRKLEKLPIEKMLKKAVNKNTYIAVKRQSFLKQSESSENEIKPRILRLKQSKSLIPANTLTTETVSKIFSSIKSLSIQENISRALFFSFANKELKWTGQVASNIFNTFDQKGEDSLSVSLVNLGLAVLSAGTITEKIGLFFEVVNNESLNEISLETLCSLLTSLEKIVDYRSNRVKSNIKLISEQFDSKINKENFIIGFLSNDYCQWIREILEFIESDKEVEINEVNFLVDGRFSDTHSPLNLSGNHTPNSDVSYNPPDIEEIEEKLRAVKKSYDEVILNSFKTVFEFNEADIEGIQIDFQLTENFCRFFVSIGKLEYEKVEKYEKIEEKHKEIDGFNNTTSENNIEYDKKHTEKEIDDEVIESANHVNSEVTNEIDIPELMKNQKTRSGCSRLCSTQKCGII